MPDLMKTRTVLQAQGWVKGSGDTERAARDRMAYAADYDEGQDEVRTTELHLDNEVYDDMGRPSAITVTVEPGDLLNEHEPAPPIYEFVADGDAVRTRPGQILVARCYEWTGMPSAEARAADLARLLNAANDEQKSAV